MNSKKNIIFLLLKIIKLVFFKELLPILTKKYWLLEFNSSSNSLWASLIAFYIIKKNLFIAFRLLVDI